MSIFSGTIRSTASARTPSGEIVDAAQVTSLGHVGTVEYATVKGYGDTEFVLSGRASDPRDFASGGPRLFVLSKGMVTDERTGRQHPLGTAMYQKAEPVPAGSYAQAAEKAERDARRAHRRDDPKVVDMLAALPGLSGSAGAVIRLADADAGSMLSKRPAAILTPGNAPVRGVGSIVHTLERKGVRLDLADGYLVATAPGGRLSQGLREAIEAASPLLVAHLQGHPLTCVVSKHKGEAPEAVTLALGGAPWCGDCAP
jgi:hypothetical protein